MIRHLLKIVWNRKRANALIAVEILLSFLVLCAVATMIVYYVDNYRKPLGYSWQDTWVVQIDMNAEEMVGAATETVGGEQKPVDRGFVAQRAQIARLLMAVRDLPDVDSAGAGFVTPYSGWTWISDIEIGGKRYEYYYSEATDDFAKSLGIEALRGRWFDKADDGADWKAVVINRRLAAEMFGDRDPIGQFITDERKPDPKSPIQRQEPRMRVVGLIEDFRKDGEFSPARNFLFARNRLDDPDVDVNSPRVLTVRVRPGTTAAFEEKLVSQLRAAAPQWTFQAESLGQARDTRHQENLVPLAGYSVVAAFLLIMVALGLTGVLWLNVTQRTREIGLRRAKGATILNVQQQLVGEVLVLTSLAVLVGVILVAQFPLLDVIGEVPAGVYVAGLAIALVGIYALTTACAYVPSRLAGNVQPADALRYE